MLKPVFGNLRIFGKGFFSGLEELFLLLGCVFKWIWEFFWWEVPWLLDLLNRFFTSFTCLSIFLRLTLTFLGFDGSWRSYTLLSRLLITTLVFPFFLLFCFLIRLFAVDGLLRLGPVNGPCPILIVQRHALSGFDPLPRSLIEVTVIGVPCHRTSWHIVHRALNWPD